MPHLTITSKAPSTDLIDLDTVKSRLAVVDASHDAELAELIEEASEVIAEEVGQGFALQDYVEETVGDEGETLHLSRFPILPETVTVKIRGEAITDFDVANHRKGFLYRSADWPRDDFSSSGVPLIKVTYRAGYVMPSQIADWAASTAKVVGDWVRPTSPALTPLLFECTTAGSTGSSEPSAPGNPWPVSQGTPAAPTTVIDGTGTWTAHRAAELPKLLRQSAFAMTQKLWEQDVVEPSRMLLPESVWRALQGWRP